MATNFRTFKIHTHAEIKASCTKCGIELKEVSNGLFSSAYFCRKCKNVYIPEMRKVPKNKLHKEFMKQCLEEDEIEKLQMEAVRVYREKKK